MSRWYPNTVVVPFVALAAVACNKSEPGARGSSAASSSSSVHVVESVKSGGSEAGPSARAAAAVGAVSSSAAARPKITRVVVITIDATRADQPWTGYTAVKTPHLSALAAKGIVYDHFYSLANTTGPSLSSFLADHYATELPRDDCPLAGFDVGNGLGPVLKAAGVWTAAGHSHAYFASSTAPRQGFVVWRSIENAAGRLATEGAVTGQDLTPILIDLWKQAPKDRPVFIWGHYLDPHDKYVVHKDFPVTKTPGRGVYDSEVAFEDAQIGRVLDVIAASPYKEQTAIFISADHGEAFGEHQRYRHGFTVFDEEVRVPFIAYVPGYEPRRISTPRSMIDLPATIADLLGVKVPAEWRGVSMVPDLAAAIPKPRPVLVDVPKLMNLPDQKAVVIGDLKAMRKGSRWTVYDLKADPKEKRPLSGKRAKAMIERAKNLVAGLKQVPSKPCRREAFRK